MTAGESAPRVYTSDASWSPKGNRSGRRYHWPREGDEALAACGLFVLDNLQTYDGDVRGEPVVEVPGWLRCKRRACARRFEEADRG